MTLPGTPIITKRGVTIKKYTSKLTRKSITTRATAKIAKPAQIAHSFVRCVFFIPSPINLRL
jgi:hypothetical protein